jgi:mannose-6-phosphate isomerase-like protein (cupin superfamily)
MKISKQDSKRHDWDKVRSWNYKLKHLDKYQSVIYAELNGNHGEVSTKDVERVYFIIEGEGEFIIAGESTQVTQGDVITVLPNTKFDYRPLNNKTLKIILFMELWDN